MDGGPEQTTWRFDTLPGGADQYAYLSDFYVVPPTCGNYDCRDYYIDLGFIPNSQFAFPTTRGPHTILVTVSDYAGNSVSQSFTYIYDNYPPTATPRSLTTPEDTPLPITLTGSDPDGDPLTFAVVTSPTHGTLSGVAPNLTYTPAADYNGNDNFTFTASDGMETSAPASVNINITPVNDVPTANPQSLSTAEDLPVNIVLTGSDPEGSLLSFTLVSTPTHGILGGSAPTLTYTPTANYHGADSFTFVVNDGLVGSAPAAVDIAVTPVNDAPVADAQSLSTAEDTPLDILLAGSDLDGDPLTFTVVLSPAHGILGGSAPNLTYTPTANYHGADSFTFVVNDGLESSAPVVVDINVTPVNDAPAADLQSVSTAEDTPLDIVLTGSDPDGDLLTFTVVLSPTHGALSGVGPNLTYTPAPGYAGPDSFSFVVNDGELDSTAAAVSITINPDVYVHVIFVPMILR
jgi:hypothetical protein